LALWISHGEVVCQQQQVQFGAKPYVYAWLWSFETSMSEVQQPHSGDDYTDANVTLYFTKEEAI
jgi:hypothetical protein